MTLPKTKLETTIIAEKKIKSNDKEYENQWMKPSNIQFKLELFPKFKIRCEVLGHTV